MTTTSDGFGNGGYVLPFLGTAAQALARVERSLDDARQSHLPVRALDRRRRKLVARVLALTCED